MLKKTFLKKIQNKNNLIFLKFLPNGCVFDKFFVFDNIKIKKNIIIFLFH